MNTRKVIDTIGTISLWGLALTAFSVYAVANLYHTPNVMIQLNNMGEMSLETVLVSVGLLCAIVSVVLKARERIMGVGV